jgi:polar amino acid transport system permease protein
MPVLASFDWDLFWTYAWPPTALQDPLVAHGLLTTVYVAVCAQGLATLIGLVGALAQLSRRAPMRLMATVYVTYFRGTPLLVQLALIYFGLAGLGLYRFPDAHLLGMTIPGVAQAGILGLALNKGAYMTEIVRGGLLAVDHGQTEAAQAIGMTRRQTLRFVILPQAARVIVPPLGNEFNSTMKDTALLTVIGGVELFHAFGQLNGRLFAPFELFFAMSLYYLALTTLWGLVQSRIERRLRRGSAGATEAARWRLRRRATLDVA